MTSPRSSNRSRSQAETVFTDLKYPLLGKIHFNEDATPMDEVEDKKLFIGFKLPSLKYPVPKKEPIKLRPHKKDLKSVWCSHKYRFLASALSDGAMEAMLKESTSDSGPLNDIKQKRIDCAIDKFTRYPSITDYQLREDLKNESWTEKRKMGYMRAAKSSEGIGIRHVYDTVLRNEAHFARSLDDTIVNEQLLALRKREVRHKRWHENVYLPTRASLAATAHRAHRPLRRTRQDLYKEYLELGNRGQSTFLESTGQDYNGYDGGKMYRPGAVGSKWKARTDQINDPTLSFQTRFDHEQRTVHRCETGHVLSDLELYRRRHPKNLVPLGRTNPDSDPREWLLMKFSDITDDSRGRAPHRRGG